jgi:hypothetical protein
MRSSASSSWSVWLTRILKLVDADNPPLRLALGSQTLPRARALYADRIATWEAWKDVSDAAQGQPTKITLAS